MNKYQEKIDYAVQDYCKSCNGQGFFAGSVVKSFPNGEFVRENTKRECTTCNGNGIDPYS